jgi:hypothetical protein
MLKRAPQEFHHWFFIEVFIIASWHIWKQMNNLISEGKRPTVTDWLLRFADEARLQAHIIKECQKQDFLSWITNAQL